ncbi:uncharacterized protein LOC115876055 isoform X2 [Sitophilus oryzae]|nr:uncharacterized protein LOC115876055 isoform X2 [Sitophilus oryzae]
MSRNPEDWLRWYNELENTENDYLPTGNNNNIIYDCEIGEDGTVTSIALAQSNNEDGYCNINTPSTSATAPNIDIGELETFDADLAGNSKAKDYYPAHDSDSSESDHTGSEHLKSAVIVPAILSQADPGLSEDKSARHQRNRKGPSASVTTQNIDARDLENFDADLVDNSKDKDYYPPTDSDSSESDYTGLEHPSNVNIAPPMLSQADHGSSENHHTASEHPNSVVINPAISSQADLSASENQPARRQRKRRGFAEPNLWKKNDRKLKQAAGQSYVDRKGIVRPRKQLKIIHCWCRFSCKNITITQQEALLEEYWSYADIARQKDHICSLVKEMPVVRKRKRKEDSEVDKKVSRAYFLPDGKGEVVRVCLPFFCTTFAISKKIVNDALFFKSVNGSYLGKDKRKGKPAHNATSKAKVQAVRRFLADFPKVPSHYCRQRSSRLYLAPDLTISKLYQLYTEREGPASVKEPVFRRIFNEFEPPLAIFQPKKDQCSICNEAERKKTTETDQTYKQHRQRKENIALMKTKDKKDAENSETMIYATFDLQAVLTLPFAGDAQIYFSRKLSLMNFTIYDSMQNGVCFLWDETGGKKGSSEIGTCLLKYIQNLPREVKHVVLYADTCGGQNRNINVFAALIYAVNTLGTLNIIDLKFMENGHSYLEADSIHATIEKNRKHKKLYLPRDYKLLIEMSRKKPFPYVVHENRFDDVYNLQDLSSKLISNRKKTTMGKDVKWLQIKWFRFLRDAKTVGFKYDVTANEFEHISFNSTDIQWNSVGLTKKYTNELPLSLTKKRDLLNLIRKGIIPQDYYSFFNNLPSARGVRDQAVWNLDNQEENADDTSLVSNND